MARDGVFPFSRYLRWIYEPTKTPLANVIFVFCIDCILLLLQLASTTAFTAIIAITTLGFQISYLMPILFRCTAARKTFPLGEFNLGPFGVPIAIISSIWLSATSIVMFFPAQYPVTKDNMNYTVVIVGGVLLIAAIYWFVSARYWFVGPKRTDVAAPILPPGHVTTEDAIMKVDASDIPLSEM
jgi:amino acid transporter